MAFVVVSPSVPLFRNETRAGVIKMLLFSLLMLCCVFILYRNSNESEALIVYDPRYRYSYYNLARGSYGGYYDQNRYEIQLDTQVTKKSSHKHKTKTQPPIDLSFEPLGALKIDSLIHGEIEINPDKIDDILLSLATGTLSMIPDFYQYIPSLPSFYGQEEPAETSSEDRSSAPRKHHRTRPSHQDESEEDRTKESSEPKDDQSGAESNNSDEKSDHERSEDDDDNAAEEHDDDSKQTPADSKPENNSDDETDKNDPKSEQEKPSKEISKEDKNSKENSKEKEPEVEVLPGVEVPIEVPPKEGYVDKFVKYYSYAKPMAKAASLFVPGLGQYRAVMMGVEMADLAYNVASMYSNGDGYLSMGYFLGKEAFKRLGRRNEPEPEPEPEPLPISQNSDTKVSSTDLDDFLEKVKSTQYPSLDEKKEQEIKTSVSDIIYKYCHDQEQYQNETERAKFIDFMISCVKFVALNEILPAASSNKST